MEESACRADLQDAEEPYSEPQEGEFSGTDTKNMQVQDAFEVKLMAK